MMITRHGSAVCRSSVRLMGSSQPVRSRDGTDKGATRQVASPWGQEEKNSERKKCRLLTCSILLLVLLRKAATRSGRRGRAKQSDLTAGQLPGDAAREIKVSVIIQSE